MPTSFKSPLTLYVLWHPDYAEGEAIAKKLFSVFSRNVDDPFARTPGIPVYFRSHPAAPDAKTPIPIPLGEADHTAIIVLVDDHMVVDEAWEAYVTGLHTKAAEAGVMAYLLKPFQRSELAASIGADAAASQSVSSPSAPR